MKNIFLLLFSLISLPALSITSFQIEKKIIYCPEKIECGDTGECDFVGEDKNYFRYLSIPSKIHVGNYYFSKAEYIEPGSAHTPSGWPTEQYSYSICSYKGFMNHIIDLVVFNGINLEPLNENWTSWPSTSEFHRKVCTSQMSNKCPLEKHSGVLFEKMIRNKDGQIYRYDDSKKTPVAIDFHVDVSGRPNPGLTVWGV